MSSWVLTLLYLAAVVPFEIPSTLECPYRHESYRNRGWLRAWTCKS